MTTRHAWQPAGAAITSGLGRHPTDPLEYTVTNHTDQHEHREEPATDRTALRDHIAEALIAWTYRGKNPEHGGILETVRANAYSRADAVLAVLPEPADRAAVLAEAIGALEAERDATDVNVAVYPRYDAKGRMVLESAISVLRRLADGSAGRVTDDTQHETLRPATTEWTFEACYDADNDKWHGIGGTYSAYAEAKDASKSRAENDSDHVKHFKFRLVRATTTYTVEDERTPPPTPPAVGGAQRPQEEA